MKNGQTILQRLKVATIKQEINMCIKYTELMFELFRLRIIKISNKYGASQEYIQGQLNAARHQVEMLGKKLQRSNSNGF